MLSDYKRYLLKIRNSFIRCGVELDIRDTQDYEDVFYLGEKLSDLLWFYSVLEISGSEDKLRGFMYPLNSFYRNNLRDRYFEEYLVYRAGYMEISASDAIMRDSIEKKPSALPSTLSFIQDMQMKSKEDEFIEWGDSEEEVLEEDAYEDEFIPWGSDEEEDEFIDNNSDEEEDEFIDNSNTKDDSLEDDEFISWGSDGTSSSDEEEDDDSFSNWGSSDEEEEIVEEEDEFIDNSSDEEEDAFSSWSRSEDEEDDFGSWGNSDDEDEFTDSSTEEEDDAFSNWGSSEEKQEVNEEDEAFSSWGSSDEDEVEDDAFSSWGTEEEEEDAFSSWGSDEEDSNEQYDEDDSFSNWGSSEESSSESEDVEGGGFGSWGQPQENSDLVNRNTRGSTNSCSKKSKLDYEKESNEKTAKVIEKIATGIFGKGAFLKSKLSEKIMNMGDTQE